jgi:manganese transport protein
MSRIVSVLFWSVLAAAFIGPGTVTTCALAGHDFGYALGWALAFSTVACIVLQEAAARLAIVTGDDVGLALRRRFHGGTGLVITALVVGAVIVGCAAYEAGNVLGAIAGLGLVVDAPAGLLSLLIVGVAALLLWPGRTGLVANAMSALVAVMGVAFAIVAVRVLDDGAAFARGLLVPTLPEGSTLVVLGLVGTTVVPYNLFLGSGLARGQHDDVAAALRESRFGIAVAVLLGGAISLGIVVAGTASVGAAFSLAALQAVLVDKLGAGATWLLPLGLFCAGLSSAVTAPLAAALTARSLSTPLTSSTEAGMPGPWGPTGARFRLVWGVVLGSGLVFGLLGIKPVPVIVMAQALNGLVLPLVAAFLLVVMNDARLGDARNGMAGNVVQGAVVAVSVVLGVLQVARAAGSAFGLTPDGNVIAGVGLGAAVVVLGVIVGVVRRDRRAFTH